MTDAFQTYTPKRDNVTPVFVDCFFLLRTLNHKKKTIGEACLENEKVNIYIYIYICIYIYTFFCLNFAHANMSYVLQQKKYGIRATIFFFFELFAVFF
jgi:hypothetical protein